MYSIYLEFYLFVFYVDLYIHVFPIVVVNRVYNLLYQSVRKHLDILYLIHFNKLRYTYARKT